MPLYLVFVNISGMYASAYLQIKYMTKAKLKMLLLLPTTWLLVLQVLISIMLVIGLYTNKVWIFDIIITNFNEFMETRLAQYNIYTTAVAAVENNPDTELKKNEEPKQRKKKFHYSPYFTDLGAMIAQKSEELVSTKNKDPKEPTALLPRILNRIGKALTYSKPNTTISDFTQKTYGSAAQLSWYAQTHYIQGVEIGKAYLGFLEMRRHAPQAFFSYLKRPLGFSLTLLPFQNGYGSVILPSFRDSDPDLLTFFDPSLQGYTPTIYDDLPGTNYTYQRVMTDYLKVRDHTIEPPKFKRLTRDDKMLIRILVDRQLRGLSLVKFGPSDLVQQLGKEVTKCYSLMFQQTLVHTHMRPGREQELNQELAKYVFTLSNYNYSLELMAKDYPITANGVIDYGISYTLNKYYTALLRFRESFCNQVASDLTAYVGEPYILPGVRGLTTPEQFVSGVGDFRTTHYHTEKAGAIYDYCYVLWHHDYYSNWQPFVARINASAIPSFQKFEDKVELLQWKRHMLLSHPDFRLFNIPTIYTGVEQFIEKYERSQAQVRLQEVYIAEYIRLVIPQTHHDTKLLIQKYSTYSVDELRELVDTEHQKRNEIFLAPHQNLIAFYQNTLEEQLQEKIDNNDPEFVYVTEDCRIVDHDKINEKRKENIKIFDDLKKALIKAQLRIESPYLVNYETILLQEATPAGGVPFTSLELLIEDIIEEGHLGAPLENQPIAVEYVPVVKGALTATDKVGQMKYNIDYSYDPFNRLSNYEFLLEHWYQQLPAEREARQEILEENLKTSPDYQRWFALCHKGYFKKDDPSVEIPQTDFFIVNGKLLAHGLEPEEMRLFHCNIDFPLAMDPDTGKFSWHPYLKIRPRRLQALQALGWERYVQEEIKSNLQECYNTNADFDYENWTTRRIMINNQRYTLINNHYLPMHFTREIPLGECQGQQVVFRHQLNSQEYEWYRKYPLEFPIRYNPVTKTFSWHERLHPERIPMLYQWPDFLAKQLGFQENTRLKVSDHQVILKYKSDKVLDKLCDSFHTTYPELPLVCEDTHPNSIVLQKLLDELWLKPTQVRPRPLEELCKEIDDVAKNFSWTEAINLQIDFTQKMQTYPKIPLIQPNVQIEGQLEVQAEVQIEGQIEVQTDVQAAVQPTNQPKQTERLKEKEMVCFERVSCPCMVIFEVKIIAISYNWLIPCSAKALISVQAWL
ncbi:hypothetical protein ACTFIW_002364, partial [Dictyostelium discoideum]